MPNCKIDASQYLLASGASATGAWVPITGGEYAFFLESATNGGTLSLQIQSPSGTAMDVQVFSGAFVRTTTTVPYSQLQVELPACNVRVALTGGAATGITAYLQGCG